METQICTKCHEEKGLNFFPRRGDRHKSICKSCVSAYDKARYATTKKTRTTSPKAINKQNVPALSKMIEGLEPILRAKAARYADDNHEAGDIYGVMVENILTKSQPDDSPALILHRADWAASEYIFKKQTYNYRVEDVEADGENFPSNKSAEDEVVEHEISNELKAVISQLSPKHQKVVTLLSLGYNQRQIAEKLKVTEQAISQQVKSIRVSMVSLGFSPA